jgi:hypothetical protein
LHVLSTPPAFVLSQDQTLQQNLHVEHFVPATNNLLPKETPIIPVRTIRAITNWHWLI